MAVRQLHVNPVPLANEVELDDPDAKFLHEGWKTLLIHVLQLFQWSVQGVVAGRTGERIRGFDWRAQEAKLNAFRQFTVPMAGIDLHFIHEDGKGPNPMPLLLSHGWTDCDGNPENALTRDEMLTNIMLYWVTGAIGSSFWPYYARLHGPYPIPQGATVDVPTGYVEFSKEILRPPRSVGERMYTNIRRWSVMPKGGHFAALEQPGALVEEIRAFFRTLR